MKSFSAATAPWVDAESTRHYEVDEIRGQLTAVWRSINEGMEKRLSENGESATVISDLFHVGRMSMLALAADSDADSMSILAGQMQDLIELKSRDD